MREYIAKDIESYFNQYERYVSHVIVAHTYHRPYVASMVTGRFKNVKPENYRRNKVYQTSKDLRYALNCFTKLLYPDRSNLPRRNPFLYRPLSFVTIEGADVTSDREKTIHVNITLGNLPSVLTTEDIETLFRHAWHNMAKQSSNVNAYDYTTVEGQSRWAGYSLKEAQKDPRKAWKTTGIWDVYNCWIPHAALNAD